MLLNIEAARKEEGKLFTAEFCEVPLSEDFPIEYTFAKPCEVKANYSFSGGKLIVTGDFTAKLNVRCGRCLKEFVSEVKGEFDEIFSDELTDEISYLLTGDEVSLDKLILDCICEELPARFLCKEDCKGLCPVCGTDLNEGGCGCINNKVSKTTNPFAKLEGLFDNTLGGVTDGSTEEKNK